MAVTINARYKAGKFARRASCCLLTAILVLSFMFAAHGNLLTPAAAGLQPGEVWEWRNPLPQGHNLHDIIWSGSQFLAVGDGGAVITSPDGEAWTVQNAGTGHALNGIARGAGKFVAVGDEGTILTSFDGKTWTAHNSGTTVNLNSVTWSGSQFVAVGAGGTVLTSNNGEIWWAQNSGTSHTFYGVTWGDDQYVAVGTYMNSFWQRFGIIYTSYDGAAWTKRYDKLTQWDTFLHDVAWDGSQFAVVAGSNILTSYDGINWAEKATDTGELRGIASNGSQFVAVGGGLNFSSIVTSTDGETWTVQDPGLEAVLFGVAWGGGRFAAVGRSGIILTSQDGEAWAAQSSGYIVGLWGIAWNGSQFAAVGNSGAILTSPDGEAWAAQDLETTSTLFDITWNGSRFVAVGDVGTILTSTDGQSWGVQSSGATGQLRGVVWVEEQSLLAVVGANGAILTSLDGEDWTAQVSGITGTLFDIAWGGSRFIAVGHNGAILTSLDGEDWTAQDPVTGHSLYNVTWNGSLFVITGGNGTILTSSDGENWTTQDPVTDQGLWGVAWSGSGFVAVGGGGTILTSPDGVDWAAQVSGTVFDLRQVVWSGKQFLAVGTGWEFAYVDSGLGAILGSGPAESKTHAIALSAEPPEGGDVDGGGTYAHGAPVTVTAQANAGYSFTSWTEGGITVSTSTVYSFDATADRTLVANFSQVDSLHGPVYPPPGGVSFVLSGNGYGREGGFTFTFTGFDPTGLAALYWGSSTNNLPGIAFDGAVDEEGETLSFDEGSSDLGGGILVFTGCADIEIVVDGVVTTITLDTRMTITFEDENGAIALLPAGEAGLSGIGGLAAVHQEGATVEQLRVNLLAEAYHNEEWQPVLDLYNSLQTAGGGRVVTDFYGGFYYLLETVAYGDVNGDEKIDTIDAVLILRHLVNLIDLASEYGSEAQRRADVNGNNDVDAGDAILILRYLAGLITLFPAEQPPQP